MKQPKRGDVRRWKPFVSSVHWSAKNGSGKRRSSGLKTRGNAALAAQHRTLWIWGSRPRLHLLEYRHLKRRILQHQQLLLLHGAHARC